MKKLILLVSLVLLLPLLVSAQSVNKNVAQPAVPSVLQGPSVADLQKLVADLTEQLRALQAQVAALQGELGKPSELTPAPVTIAPVSNFSPTTPTSTPDLVPISESTPPELTRSLSRGSSGDDVRKLQEFLSKDKDIYPDGLITGYFGPLTESAVKRWQEKHGVESIGVIGPKTIARFQELGRGVIQGLLEQGAGRSGLIPPGLLTAPGIQTKATTTPQTTTTTLSTATTTLQATTTPSGTTPAIPAIPAQPSPGIGGFTLPAQPATPAVPAQQATTTTPSAHVCGTPIYVPQDASSIQAALNLVCSGDTIYVNAGTYYENLSIPRSGVTLKGATGTTAETVVVDGGGKGNVIFATGIQNFTIDGFTLRNASQSNNDNCGFVASPCSAGIYFTNFPNYDAGTIAIRNLIVRKNVYGIFMREMLGGSVTLERNVIVENQDAAVSMSVCGSSSATVTNNTIANNNGYYTYLDNCRLGSRTLRNNIIAKNAGMAVNMYSSSPKTILYNDVWSNTGGGYRSSNVDNPSWVSFSPSPGTGELSVDPQFVSASDYHLQSTSPAINVGDPGSQYNDPNGTRNDIGAYPFTGTSAPADTTAPSAPNVSYVIHSTQVDLSWVPSTDNVGVAGYKIYRGGSLLTSFSTTTTSMVVYYDTNLSPGTTYAYVVNAYDAAGNVSLPNSANITTLSATTATTTASTYLPELILAPMSASAASGLGNTSSPFPLNTPVKVSLTIQNSNTYCGGCAIGAVNNAIPDFVVEKTWLSSDITNGQSSGITMQNVVNNCPSNLAPGASCTASFELVFTTSGGSQLIYVRVDPSNRIPEINDGNDAGSISFVVATPPPADTQAPSTPTGLTVTPLDSSGITLSWNASTDNVGVVGYKIYQNGVFLINAFGSPVNLATGYTYTIAAYDAAGNVSSQSTSVSATTPASITITYPNGGETWEAGKTYTITWNSTGNINGVLLFLANEAGQDYVTNLVNVYGNPGSAQWTASSFGLAHNRILIHGCSAVNCTVGNTKSTESSVASDLSDSYFNIVSATSSSNSVSVNSNLASLLESLRSLVAALQKLQSSAR